MNEKILLRLELTNWTNYIVTFLGVGMYLQVAPILVAFYTQLSKHPFNTQPTHRGNIRDLGCLLSLDLSTLTRLIGCKG